MACGLYHPYEEGGGEISTRLLAHALQRQGIGVTVLTVGRADARETDGPLTVVRMAHRNLYWSPDRGRQPRWRKVVWHLVDGANPWMASRVERVLEEIGPRALITSTLENLSPLVWRAARRRGLRVAHVLRSHALLCPNADMFRNGHACLHPCLRCRTATAHARWLTREVDVVVGTSRYILDRHRAAGCFPAARGVVIPNICEAPSPATEHRERAPGSPLVLGYLGRLHANKGIELLLSAAADSRVRDRVEIVIGGAGDPRYEAGLQAKARALRVGARFIGHTTPSALLETVDYLVVPSLVQEAFGRVVVEALAHGVPVIATDRGALPELVPSGAGYVVPPEVSSLADCLAHVLDAPPLVPDRALALACTADAVARRYLSEVLA